MPITTNKSPVKTASTRRQTTFLLALAAGLRLLVVLFVARRYPPAWLFTRGQEMGLLAKSLLAGQGLSSPFGPPTGPTAFIAPGYPLLIAAVFRVFGSDSFGSALVIMAAQSLLNLLTIWLMMAVARRLFDQRVAFLAGLVWACSLPLIWMPTIFWDTSLAICLLTGLLVMVLAWRGSMSLLRWTFLGTYCALTALINPALLLVLAAMAGWLAFQERRSGWSGVLVTALIFVIIYSPWPIRNERVFHAFIPLRTTVGFELWMGNRPGATGFLDESLFPSFNPQELADYKVRGELGYTAHKSELAQQFIFGHPVLFLRLTALRVVRYWFGTGAEHGSPIFALHAGATFLLGMAGLWLLFTEGRRAVGILFALPFLLFPLPYYITHAEFRYRLMLDPMLTILAAYAVVTFWRRFHTPSQAANV